MKQRTPRGGALLRIVALGGLLVVPAVAGAQLKCLLPSDKEIRAVSFDGNVVFSDADLRKQVIAEPTDAIRRVAVRFFGTRRCARPGLLAGDSVRLKAFYTDQGFPDAKVTPTKKDVSPRFVDINFKVSEGTPVVIDSVSITGLEGLDLGGDVRRVLNSRVGGRFSLALLLSDVDTIETRLRNSGYPNGVALKELQVDERAHTARVGLNIEPGPKAYFGKITILDTTITGRGPVVTSASIRQLLAFHEGDLYRERLLTQSQRQLYQLGTFFHAEVEPVPGATPGNPSDSSLVFVRVRVVEDLMRQFSYSGGWGTQDCFQTGFQYSDKAVLHGIDRFELNSQLSKLGWANRWPVASDLCHSSLSGDEIASNKVNYNVTARLTQPASFGGRLDRSFAAYSEIRGAYKSYLRTTPIGFATSIAKDLATNTTQDGFKQRLVGQLGYNLEYGHTDAPAAVLCFIFRACTVNEQSQLSADRRLAVMSGVLSRDWRDSPVIPTSGTLARLEGRVSSTLLGSSDSVAFRKGVGDFTWYHKAIKSDVVVMRLRGGIIGGGAAAGGSRLVPQQERLYTGGETSVRGFGPNELGPLIYVVTSIDTTTIPGDTTFGKPARVIPTGGNAMIVMNYEYRVRGPIFHDRLQTILFADAGKLWTRAVDQSAQPFKWTPGIAFRVFSPFGPVQFNIAYNNYRDPLGPVFYDPGISGSSVAPLVCVSNTSASTSGECQATYARPLPTTFFSRLKFSIAFPPDY